MEPFRLRRKKERQSLCRRTFLFLLSKDRREIGRCFHSRTSSVNTFPLPLFLSFFLSFFLKPTFQGQAKPESLFNFLFFLRSGHHCFLLKRKGEISNLSFPLQFYFLLFRSIFLKSDDGVTRGTTKHTCSRYSSDGMDPFPFIYSINSAFTLKEFITNSISRYLCLSPAVCQWMASSLLDKLHDRHAKLFLSIKL